MLDIVFDGRLIFPPIGTVKSVLDCGYGAASWAAEVAEQYPDCTVRLPVSEEAHLIDSAALGNRD